MEKEFIPYEQALALKELGFDEPCFNYYGKNNKLPHQLDCMFGYRAHFNKNFCLAPLYQQAFRWFREKYGYYVKIDYISYVITSIKEQPIIELTKSTYEEAQLECLIKLIEIVKNK